MSITWRNLSTKYFRLKRKEHTDTENNNNNNSRHWNKHILKKLEKSRKKKKKEGRQLGRNTRNLNLTGKGSNTLDFYIEKFSTLGTQLKLSHMFCKGVCKRNCVVWCNRNECDSTTKIIFHNIRKTAYLERRDNLSHLK